MSKALDERSYKSIKKLLNRKGYTRKDVMYITNYSKATVERVAVTKDYADYKALSKKQHPKKVVIDAKKSFWNRLVEALRFS